MRGRRRKYGRYNEAAKALDESRVKHVDKLYRILEELMPTTYNLLFPAILDFAHIFEDSKGQNDVELDRMARFLETITPMVAIEYRISVDVLLKLLSKALDDLYDPFYAEFEAWLESRFGTKDWQKVPYIDRREVVRYLSDTLFKYMNSLDGGGGNLSNDELPDSGEKREELFLAEPSKSLRELNKRFDE